MSFEPLSVIFARQSSANTEKSLSSQVTQLSFEECRLLSVEYAGLGLTKSTEEARIRQTLRGRYPQQMTGQIGIAELETTFHVEN